MSDEIKQIVKDAFNQVLDNRIPTDEAQLDAWVANTAATIIGTLLSDLRTDPNLVVPEAEDAHYEMLDIPLTLEQIENLKAAGVEVSGNQEEGYFAVGIETPLDKSNLKEVIFRKMLEVTMEKIIAIVIAARDFGNERKISLPGFKFEPFVSIDKNRELGADYLNWLSACIYYMYMSFDITTKQKLGHSLDSIRSSMIRVFEESMEKILGAAKGSDSWRANVGYFKSLYVGSLGVFSAMIYYSQKGETVSLPTPQADVYYGYDLIITTKQGERIPVQVKCVDMSDVRNSFNPGDIYEYRVNGTNRSEALALASQIKSKMALLNLRDHLYQAIGILVDDFVEGLIERGETGIFILTPPDYVNYQLD